MGAGASPLTDTRRVRGWPKKGESYAYIALFSSSRAVENLMSGLNVVNGFVETRGVLHRKALTVALTLTMILGLLLSISVVGAIVLLTWMWLSAFIILLGALVNAERAASH